MLLLELGWRREDGWDDPWSAGPGVVYPPCLACEDLPAPPSEGSPLPPHQALPTSPQTLPLAPFLRDAPRCLGRPGSEQPARSLSSWLPHCSPPQTTLARIRPGSHPGPCSGSEKSLDLDFPSQTSCPHPDSVLLSHLWDTNHAQSIVFMSGPGPESTVSGSVNS